MAELLRVAGEYFTRDMWTALPGQVTRYDADKQMADVKPLVQDLVSTEDGDEFVEPIPVISNVPVRFPRAGGFYITMPVEKGDYCLLVFCSRSIDKYLEGTGNDTDPGDFRTHDLADAVAFMGVGPFSSALREDGIGNNLVLGKEGGVSVHIKGDGTIHLGSEDAADALALASKVKAELDAVKVDQDALKVLLATHVHPGVTTGPGLTGPSPGFVGYTPHTPASVDSDVVKAD